MPTPAPPVDPLPLLRLVLAGGRPLAVLTRTDILIYLEAATDG